MFKEGLKKLFKDTLESRDFQSEALLLSKLTKIIRREIFQWKCFSFHGQFPQFPNNCQCDSIPPLLKSLVSILINGQDICASESQASLTIAQLIYFNAKSKCNQVSATRHVQDREPPLPIYLGLQVHTLTRSNC